MKRGQSDQWLWVVSTESGHQALRGNFLIWHSWQLSREKISFLHSNVHRLGQIAAVRSHFNHGKYRVGSLVGFRGNYIKGWIYLSSHPDLGLINLKVLSLAVIHIMSKYLGPKARYLVCVGQFNLINSYKIRKNW